MKRYSTYDKLAWLYDPEWGFYAKNIFPLLKQIAGKKLPDKGKILDVGCGTGLLAKVLSEKGYSVTGIDSSAEMLRYARENAPTAEFILTDARDFRLPSVYSASFSTFDALNHILSLKELQKVFQNVSECLLPGGIFVFDLNTDKHFELLNKQKEIRDKPGYFVSLLTEYFPKKRLIAFKFIIFRKKRKKWERYEITIHETFYPDNDVKSALSQAGFTVLKTYSFSREHGLEKVSPETRRIFYYARKA